ncbi:hypothetical protein MTR67_047842 [Solanum verrucosum]|uniref:Uncharacterized protein n=1 Tax=Solanum verrucosum TaxID=315347 RepID=A0AAF0UXC6_SOLVR|nr:hypothetical protein MTR67_047842 [Solanum verrucosum]
MVDDMRSRMILFVVGLTSLSSKESMAAMLIGYMGITRLMIHVQQVESDQLRDKEEFKNKRAKTLGNVSGQQKSNANRTRVVKFQIPNESVIEWSSSSVVPKGRFISYLKARTLVSKGCVYHLVRVNDSSVEIPLIQSDSVVRQFPEVFPDDLPVVPPERGRLQYRTSSRYSS